MKEKNNYTTEVWLTASGKRMKIRTMDEYHIKNCMRLISGYSPYHPAKSMHSVFEQELERRKNKEIDNYEIY